MAPRSCNSSTHASSSSGLMPLEAAISFGREHCAGGTGANYEDRNQGIFLLREVGVDHADDRRVTGPALSTANEYRKKTEASPAAQHETLSDSAPAFSFIVKPYAE